ncbi:hypothetical protein IW510_09830 [Enterococcus sp. BWR-S5]|nr:hypothetical protein [Enterococcus sp. BWR-S5]
MIVISNSTTIDHLNWIITELEELGESFVYVEHEFFDENIVFDIDKATKMRDEFLKEA